jgi:hypothetical protein
MPWGFLSFGCYFVVFLGALLGFFCGMSFGFISVFLVVFGASCWVFVRVFSGQLWLSFVYFMCT